jgi:protein TonB
MTAPIRKTPRPVVIATAIGVVLLVLVIFGIYKVVTAPAQKKQREVQNVQIVRPPPPPPENQPPPPPPPPEHEQEQLQQNEPEPSPDNSQAQAGPLGLDSEGGAGGDAFGLVARKGGRDLAGTGGAIFGWYTQMLRDAINDRLAVEKELRTRRYAVVVAVHLSSDGTVLDAHLLSSTGSRDIDGLIERSIAKVGRLREERPKEMPAMVKLKVTSRM